MINRFSICLSFPAFTYHYKYSYLYQETLTHLYSIWFIFEEVKFLCLHNHTAIGISHSHNGYS